MNYPAHLATAHDFVIAQLSDLHLSSHTPATFDNFLAVLALAQSHRPDLLLLTGDLVNDGDTSLYDWLFDTLKKTRLPFLCLAGNHDVTYEIGHDLPFEQRQFLPINKNPRLIDQHRLTIDSDGTLWQLLLINSAVAGQIFGQIERANLDFLKTHLSPTLPTIIALHHPPACVGSAWIDAHRLVNDDEFWQTLAPHQNLHIVCGHVHQAHTLPLFSNTLHTCPATARQFLPHHDDFALDNIPAGFRLICLKNEQFNSQIIRLSSS